MGIWYAKRCEPVVQGSVINLSNDCMQFLQTGKAPRKTMLKKNFPLEEESYFTTMRAMDEAHTRSSGVSFENFKKMANSLESSLTSNRNIPCAKKKLLTCLRDNEFCMIKCRKELDKFIDCVDAMRLEVIKRKYQSKEEIDSSKQKVYISGETKCPGPKKKMYLSD